MSMCENPYMKTKAGLTRLHCLLSDEARAAATPFSCGECLPCKINAKRIWTHRINLEATQHPYSTVVTLTYNDEHYPEKGNLQPRDIQLFFKRLRKLMDPRKIRYFAVGEYGGKTWRPHYHLVIFGMHISEQMTIENAWTVDGTTIGYVQVGDVNKSSVNYVTGYVLKKMTKSTDRRLEGRSPEFMRSSRGKGGLGLGAIEAIAKSIKENKYQDLRIIRELQYGKSKKLPLGKYLTTKLSEMQGVQEGEIQLATWQYQEDILNKHMTPRYEYYRSIQEEKRLERISQEGKIKIYKRRESL